MDDQDKTQILKQSPAAERVDARDTDAARANTAQLPRLDPDFFKSPAERKEENFRLGQNEILKRLAANAPLSEILNRLVELIEAQSSDMLCSVLLLSDDGDHVRHGAAPSLPKDYVDAVDGSPIGPKHGSCGTAMYRGEPVVVTDIFSDPLWEDYRELAAATGLCACWSTPIMSGRGKVIGSFAMYYREPRTPTGEEAGLTEVATRIAALAIEHNSAREVLARTQAELAQATYAASASKVVVSVADELQQQVEAMVDNAKKLSELLDEDKPEIASFREPLKTIRAHGQRALSIIASIPAGTKK